MSSLPRLGIFHNQWTVSIFDLVAAARGVCRIVWIIGWEPNPSDARILARFGDVADVTGMEEIDIVRFLRDFDLEGVAVFNDPPIVLAAAIAQALGLRFHTPMTASVLSDKYLQRECLQRAQVPVPAFAAVSLEEPKGDVPFPAVLKPRAGAGARDTFLVHTREETVSALEKCDPSEEFILEEWLCDRDRECPLSADIVSVETIAIDGLFQHAMVTGRFPYAPPFRDTGGFLPSDIEPDDRIRVCALAEESARAVGIRDGVIHTEIKLTPIGPRVVEINGRLGGGVSKLIERVGGPSLATWVMKMALGQDVGEFPVLGDTPIAFFYFVVAPESASSVVDSSGITELSEMKDQLGIDEITVNFQLGDPVNTQQSSFTAHLMRVDGVVDSVDQLAKTVGAIKGTVSLTWRLW